MRDNEVIIERKHWSKKTFRKNFRETNQVKQRQQSKKHIIHLEMKEKHKLQYSSKAGKIKNKRKN